MASSTDNNDTNDAFQKTIPIRGMECKVHYWNVHQGSKKPKALAVVFHGFLAHGNYPTVRYAAECLASSGYAVVAVDLPGHGQSQGLRGYVESDEILIQDGQTIVNYATSLFPASKLFLVGSSMGGSIACAVASKLAENKALAGVVLLAPMLQLNVNGLEHAALTALSYIMPTLQVIPSSATNAEKQYRDPAKRQECEQDEYTVSGANLRVASALACVNLTHRIQQEIIPQINFPILVLVAGQDVVVKNQGSQYLMEHSPSTTDKTMKEYPALHGLLCEPQPLLGEIQKDMIDWMDAH